MGQATRAPQSQGCSGAQNAPRRSAPWKTFSLLWYSLLSAAEHNEQAAGRLRCACSFTRSGSHCNLKSHPSVMEHVTKAHGGGGGECHSPA